MTILAAGGWLLLVILSWLSAGCSNAPGVFERTKPELSWTPQPAVRTSQCHSRDGLPDVLCTPGALDARVQQSSIGSTICVAGYSRSVRPPTSVSAPIKIRQMRAYGVEGQPAADFELDHLVSLELGGAPRALANLWPQPWTGQTGARAKDATENFLKRQVCSGQLLLVQAQRLIATDWTSLYRRYGLAPEPEDDELVVD